MNHREELARIDAELDAAHKAFKHAQRQLYHAAMGIKKLVNAREDVVNRMYEEFWSGVERTVGRELEAIARGIWQLPSDDT